VHRIALLQQQLGQVRAILASDAGDQGCFHATTYLYLVYHRLLVGQPRQLVFVQACTSSISLIQGRTPLDDATPDALEIADGDPAKEVATAINSNAQASSFIHTELHCSRVAHSAIRVHSGSTELHNQLPRSHTLTAPIHLPEKGHRNSRVTPLGRGGYRGFCRLV
jgi:hypothetical protein